MEANLSTLVGGSVRGQLLKLHMADRDASLETLLFRIGIRRTKLTPTQCPALTHRLDELRKLSIDIPKYRTYTVLHPVGHRIVMRINGAYIEASFDDPGNSLVRWGLDTLASLNDCGNPIW